MKRTPGLQKHQPWVGTDVDVHLIILIVPIETPPGLSDGNVPLLVGLHEVLMKEFLRGEKTVCLFT